MNVSLKVSNFEYLEFLTSFLKNSLAVFMRTSCAIVNISKHIFESFPIFRPYSNTFFLRNMVQEEIDQDE